VHKNVQFLFKISTRFLHGSDTTGAPTPHTFPFAVFRGPLSLRRTFSSLLMSMRVRRKKTTTVYICPTAVRAYILYYFIFIFIHQWMLERMQCNIQFKAMQ